MLKVAITGNIASGKSSAENILSDLGYKVIDTDKIAHTLLDCDEIHSAFADFDVFENNKISRTKLGKLVFSNNELKTKLENIIHPKIRGELEKFFTEYSSEKYVFVGIPLLFEANMEDMFDRIILIYSDDNIRLERLMRRNGYDRDYAQQRMSCQLSQNIKAQKSDYIIYNNTTVEDLKTQVQKLLLK